MLTAAEIARHSGPLVVCTACDFPFARVLERAGVDVILVGDSLANVALGLPSTRGVGMPEMEIFSGAVRRGAPGTHVTVDLPYGSDATVEAAVRNGARLVETGASSVKLEGSKPGVIRALVGEGIPVMGHLGVLPQTATSFKKVGAGDGERDRLLAEASEIRDAGVFAMVLENVDVDVTREITAAVDVPTIGIGSGPHVRGQVQVLYDILGLAEKSPPFAKRFVDLASEAEKAVKAYANWVRNG